MKTKYLLSSAAAAILSSGALAAHAADANGDGAADVARLSTVTDASTATAAADTTAAVGDIIVTAQRRAENVQAVPMTLTAITAKSISQQNI
jgi:iron complex outermembrane receptor protein